MSDERFLHNAREARSNGFYLCCAGCGVGLNDEDFEDADEHETDCEYRGVDRTQAMLDFLAERLGGGEEK